MAQEPLKTENDLLRAQLSELTARFDGLLAGLIAGGKNPAKIMRKADPEPEFPMVRFYVPFACYINGVGYLGDVNVPENVALALQSILSQRKDHDLRLTQAKSPVDYEVGSISRNGQVKRILPDVV
jgi:hypothetical protein